MFDLFTGKDISGIVKLAMISRAFYLAVSYTSHLIISRFDKSTEKVQSESCLKFLLSWDAVYFFEISKNGYRRLHELAFFPLLPYISRCIGRVLSILDLFTIGAAVSCITFVFASAILYKLTTIRYGHDIAWTTCILFIFNPASIVYTSMYSESIFTLMFLLGLYFMERNNRLRGIIHLSMCGLCRSNGILFVLLLIIPLDRYMPVRVSLFLLPFALFQLYCLLEIDKVRGVASFFMPYSQIQKDYWNQGLFKFIKFRNIPNILIGFPFILISCCVLQTYMSTRKSFDANFSYTAGDCTELEINNDMCAAILAIQVLITIFIVHWNMHFRFVSFNPIIYWMLAIFYHRENSQNTHRKFLLRFYFCFGISYALLFGSFYPPC